MNLNNTIAPKSTQLNADDLIGGPITVRITAVQKGPSAEQPIAVHFEGGDGRPYLPGKSMRRVLVAMWGGDGSAYVGRSLTLYCDPSVRFGGQQVGGIRISHATGITEPFSIALTETRGKKKPHTVQPLKDTQHATQQRAAQSQATDNRASIDEAIFAAEQIGPEKARKGSAALREWWMSLPAAVKTALEKKKDAEWKPLAADCDAGT